MGRLNTAESGRSCLAWKDVVSNISRDDISGYENYCRNPNGWSTQPWCYTALGCEFCKVPDCGEYHVPGFQPSFSFFCIILYWPN